MRRRALLGRAACALSIGSLSGCLGTPGASTPTPSPDPTDSWDRAPTPKELTFEVRDRQCGSGENAATVTFSEDAVQVEGVIAGRDTCDTASLQSARVHLDVFRVIVEVVEPSRTSTAACGQCRTDIEYRVAAAGLRGGPARVRVHHRTADGEQTVTVADRP